MLATLDTVRPLPKLRLTIAASTCRSDTVQAPSKLYLDSFVLRPWETIIRGYQRHRMPCSNDSCSRSQYGNDARSTTFFPVLRVQCYIWLPSVVHVPLRVSKSKSGCQTCVVHCLKFSVSIQNMTCPRPEHKAFNIILIL